MKTTTLLVVAWLCSVTAFAIEKQSKMVLFETDKHELQLGARQTLDSLIRAAQKLNDFQLNIIGHTDDVGSNVYNTALSQRRADAVKEYFVSRGIEEGIIATNYFGETRPLAREYDVQSRKVNRRVEVELLHLVFSSIHELDSLLKSRNRQYFRLKPNAKRLIEGKSGTKILVHPNSLVDIDGSPIHEEVELQLIEAVSKDQFLTNNLLTMSDGKLLESGGMLHLQLETTSGKKVQINPNAPLTVQLPTAQKVEDMLYFTSTGGQNWSTQNISINRSYDKLKRPKLETFYPSEPEFKSTIKHPKKPTHPAIPRKPKAPRQEMYKPQTGFFAFFMKDKLKADAQARYDNAYNKYLERFAKYEQRLEHYKKEVVAYHLALASYEHEEHTYQAKKAAEYETFKNSDTYKAYYQFYDSLNAKAYKKYENELVAYQGEKKRQLLEWAKNIDEMGTNNNIQLTQSYVFQVNTLNWINCDRFYNTPMKDVIVETRFNGASDDLRAYIIFDEINSIMGAQKNVNQQQFNLSVPKQEKSHFFAYGINKKGQTVMYENYFGESATDTTKAFVVEPKVCKLADILAAMQSYS